MSPTQYSWDKGGDFFDDETMKKNMSFVTMKKSIFFVKNNVFTDDLWRTVNIKITEH